jgi:D-specific alpha-keto acid dehydrogenase
VLGSGVMTRSPQAQGCLATAASRTAAGHQVLIVAAPPSRSAPPAPRRSSSAGRGATIAEAFLNRRISSAYRKPDTHWQHPAALTDRMIRSEPARTTARRTRSPASSSSSAVPTIGITIYGCGQDEAALFREMALRLGVVPTITEAAVSEGNVGLAFGNRCISIDHKTRVTNSTLLALSEAAVTYISTRSVGYDHIDVEYAEAVGISVETVAYSPDSVADYTLMLMLMAVRHAKSVVKRADLHDYRLHDVRGKELRDLTVGVIGTGRIGAAVMDRLRGFGCRILAYDTRPKTPADYVSLGELLEQSDVVTLHTPLTVETHHLLDRHRIERMKHGAVIINTGRGALLDTEALVSALESGRSGGAALDVLEGEEGIFYADCSDKPIESRLLLRLHELPNVLVSPHTAYYTDHALSDTVEHSLSNCLAFAGRDQHA